MSFDAGAILGGLKFDASEWVGGLKSAASSAASFGKDAAALFGGIEVEAAAMAAAVVATIGAMVVSIAGRFQQIDQVAEQLGVTTEFISTLGEVAKSKNVDIQQLALSLTQVQRRAADAMAGSASAAKGFADIGVGVRELNTLMQDPQQLFYRIAQGISSIEQPALRLQAANDLMGRSGARLIGILSEGPARIKELQQGFSDLGAGVNSAEGQMGEKFALLGTEWDAAWEGIKKAAAEPFLKELTDHGGDINSILSNTVTIVRDIASVAAPLIGMATQGLSAILSLTNGLTGAARTAFDDLSGNIDGGRSGGGDFGSGGGGGRSVDGGGITVNANIGPIDSDKAAGQIAAKLSPSIRQATMQQYRALDAAAKHSKVASAIGARGPSHYQPGL